MKTRNNLVEFFESLEEDEDIGDISEYQEPQFLDIDNATQRAFFMDMKKAYPIQKYVAGHRTLRSGDIITVDGMRSKILGFNENDDCFVYTSTDYAEIPKTVLWDIVDNQLSD